MKRWLLCISNQDHVFLTALKLYRQLRDPMQERAGLVRVVDNTGRDYLFPGKLFVRALGGRTLSLDDIDAELSRLARARLSGKDPPGSWAGAVRAAKAAKRLPATITVRTSPAIVLALLARNRAR